MKLAEVLSLDTKEANLLVMKCSEEILDVIYNQDNYTTSDLQGRVGAIVLNILRIGANLEK
jgi:hypothetical protein